MKRINTIEDINRLIDEGVEESTTLEYKSCIDNSTKHWKLEMAKDVSAMANANGGIIIYGIKEYDEEDKRHLPEKVTPLDSTRISKETIAQVISDNISPKINAIEIDCIVVDKVKTNEVVYVVNIPQSYTAHQNLKTKLYHKRYSTTINSMEDYEIRDVMNRNIHPNVILEFEIKTITTNQESYWMSPIYNTPFQGSFVPVSPRRKQYTTVVLNCIPKNIGTVVANNVHYFIKLPTNILPIGQELDVVDEKGGYTTIRRENIYCDMLGGTTHNHIQYGPPRVVPILPGMAGVYRSIMLVSTVNLNQDTEIFWTLNADGATLKKGKIKLKEIPRRQG